MAVVFDWGRSDWWRWLPEPILMDARRLRHVGRARASALENWWDPAKPVAADWAPGWEIPPDGIVGRENAVPRDLSESRLFERALAPLHALWQSASVRRLGLDREYAVALCRALNEVEWQDRLPIIEPFAVYQWDSVLRGSLIAPALGDALLKEVEANAGAVAVTVAEATDAALAATPDFEPTDVPESTRVHDREELQMLISAEPLLDPVAERLVAASRVGLQLICDPHRDSRLGGPTLLPRGARRPTTPDGRPLSCVSRIRLEELPSFSGRARFPAGGWLLFFANLELRPIPAANAAGRQVIASQALLVASTGELCDPGQPTGVRMLGERRISFAPACMLPPHDAIDGLNERQIEAYDRIAETIAVTGMTRRDDGRVEWRPLHWFGGLPEDAQGAQPLDDVLLLHLSSDESLDFAFLDAGTLQFLIPAAALAQCDFTQAYCVVESA